MSNLYARIDVALTRDPRMIAAAPMARLMYIQCVLYARENLTDGAIDRHLLSLIAVDLVRPSRLMQRLVDVGALTVTDTGWQIPLDRWCRYNPMRAEINEKRQAEAERKAAYRERQRTPDVSQRDTRVADGTRANSHSHSHSHSHSQRDSSSTDGFNRTDPPPVENLRIEAALKHIIEQRINGRPQGKNPAYRRTVTNDVTATHRAELERLAAKYPTAPADVLAASAQGDTHSLRHYDEGTAL